METAGENVKFNGAPQDVVGRVCTGFVVQHFYDGFLLTDPANVVYFRFGEDWHRIYFETGTVFWRTGDSPISPKNSTLAHGLLLNDLSEMPGVVGHRLVKLKYQGATRGDVTVSLQFEGGVKMSLRYDEGADSTRIDV